MSYPKNQAITYTAVAATQGAPSNTFTYAWTFDDGGTGNTASLTHTWATTGNHTATISVTDNQTGGTATTSKTINVIDASAFAWVSSGVTWGNWDSALNHMPVLANDGRIIHTGQRLDPLSIYAYTYPSTSAIVATRTGCGGSNCKMALLPDGRILCAGGEDTALDTTYGFFNPSNNSFTKSTNTMPARVGATASDFCKISATKFMHRPSVYTSFYGYSNTFQIYDSSSDSWTTTSSAPSNPTTGCSLYKLNNGNILVIYPTVTHVYNPTANTWATVTTPFNTSSDIRRGCQKPDGSVYVLEAAATPLTYKFNESTSSWDVVGVTYVAGGTGSQKNLRVLSDNSIINAIGLNSSGGSLAGSDVYYVGQPAWLRSYPASNIAVGETIILPSGIIVLIGANGYPIKYSNVAWLG